MTLAYPCPPTNSSWSQQVADGSKITRHLSAGVTKDYVVVRTRRGMVWVDPERDRVFNAPMPKWLAPIRSSSPDTLQG